MTCHGLLLLLHQFMTQWASLDALLLVPHILLQGLFRDGHKWDDLISPLEIKQWLRWSNQTMVEVAILIIGKEDMLPYPISITWLGWIACVIQHGQNSSELCGILLCCEIEKRYVFPSCLENRVSCQKSFSASSRINGSRNFYGYGNCDYYQAWCNGE